MKQYRIIVRNIDGTFVLVNLDGGYTDEDEPPADEFEVPLLFDSERMAKAVAQALREDYKEARARIRDPDAFWDAAQSYKVQVRDVDEYDRDDPTEWRDAT